MKTQTYVKEFATEKQAMAHMSMINHGRAAVGNRELLVVVDGPNDNFAVVDLETAIDLGNGYKWEVA